MLSDDPAVNTRIWDTVPTGVTYVSQSSGLTFNKTGSLLKWSFPVTIYDQPATTLTWWGTVACSASNTVTNVAAIVDDTTLAGGGAPVTSNLVSAAVTGCSTPTPPEYRDEYPDEHGDEYANEHPHFDAHPNPYQHAH